MMKSLILILVGLLGVSSSALDTSSFYKRKWTTFEARCKSNGRKVAAPEAIWVFHRGVLLNYASEPPVETPFKFKGNSIMISGYNRSEYMPIDIVPDMFTLTMTLADCPGNQQAEIIFGTGDPDPGQW